MLLRAVCTALAETELPALELKVKNGDGDAWKIQQRLLAKLEKQMEDYRAQEERQYELLETNPNYPPEVFERRNKQLREKMDECQAAIRTAKASMPKSVDFSEKVTTLKEAIAVLRDPEAPVVEQNKILRAVIERIEFSSVPPETEKHTQMRGEKNSPFELLITLRL